MSSIVSASASRKIVGCFTDPRQQTVAQGGAAQRQCSGLSLELRFLVGAPVYRRDSSISLVLRPIVGAQTKIKTRRSAARQTRPNKAVERTGNKLALVPRRSPPAFGSAWRKSVGGARWGRQAPPCPAGGRGGGRHPRAVSVVAGDHGALPQRARVGGAPRPRVGAPRGLSVPCGGPRGLLPCPTGSGRAGRAKIFLTGSSSTSRN